MEQRLYTKCQNMYSRLFNDWDKDGARVIYFVKTVEGDKDGAGIIYFV